MRQSKFHRDIRPIKPNHWVKEHIDSTEHEVLHIMWTKEDVEEMEDRNPFSDEQWKRIVSLFNGQGFDDIADYITYIVDEVMKNEET